MSQSFSEAVEEEHCLSSCFLMTCLFARTYVCQSEERAQFEILKAQMFAERAAKRERRPKRARAMPEEEAPSKGQKSHHSTEQAETVVGHQVSHCPVSVQQQQPNRRHRKVARSRPLTKN